jgi:MFS family permease
VTTHLRLQPRALATRVVGGAIDPPLRPVLGVAFMQAIAEGAQTAFLGLWALRALGSSQAQLGLAFAATAIAAVIAGYTVGRHSDRIGRRTPILAASAALAVIAIALGFVEGHVLLGLTLIVGLGVAGGILLTTGQALLVDLVPPDRSEHAFAAARVVQNLGFVGGPLLGAALLTLGWRALFLGTGAIATLAFFIALKAIPKRAEVESERTAPARGSSLRVLARDRSFTLVLAASTLAAMVYVSYETLLPISLVQGHGLAPAAWGVLLAINPIIVVLFQLRLSARVGQVRELTRIAVGVAAMGAPFLLVAASTALPLLILMLLLFVLGEMLWVPPSQGLIARLAPEEMRGAYIGASSAIWPIALALTPFAGLQIRSSHGDTAMWFVVALIAALAIGLYGAAERLGGRGAVTSQRPAPPIA